MANEDPNKSTINQDPLADASETPDLGNELPGTDPEALAAAAAEGEGDEGDEGGEGEGASSGKGSQFVPHSRFHEVNERAKAAEAREQQEREARIRLEERIRMLEGAGNGGQQAPAAGEQAPAFDIKAKIKERNAAILEGDDDRVAEIELEIEQHRIAEAEARAVRRIEQTQQQTALQQAAAAVVDAYPFLDSNSPNVDREALNEVKEWRDFYIGQGKAPHTALEQAVKRLKPQLDAKLGTAPAPKAKTAEEMAAEKRAASITRNAQAANGQPPPPGGQSNGITPTTLDPTKMTGDDWMKLPEKERERHLV